MRSTIAFALAFVCLLPAAPARAATPDEQIAKAHFQTGEGYFGAGRYEQAVREFLEAYRLSRKVDLLWNIARCYQHMDDPGRMTSYYKQYLAARPAAQDRAQIEAEIARAAPRVGTLIVHSSAPGAELRVDGELVGLAPVDPILLTAGRHKVEASHGEYAPFAVEVDVPGGTTTEVTATLKEAGAPPPAVEPAPALERPADLVAPPPPPPQRRWVWGVVGGAAAAVVVAAAVVIAVLAAGATDFAAQARGLCTDPARCTLLDGSR